MKTLTATSPFQRHAATLFRAMKYLIYCLLAYNVLLFLREDMAAAAETFGQGVGLAHLAEAYSATLDTAAWVVLLLLFELETAVIPDEKLTGRLKWCLMAIRSVSYALILWAFWGYCTKYLQISDFQPFLLTDLCSLVGQGYTWVADLDEYLPLDTNACVALQGQPLFLVTGTQIIGTAEALRAAINLSIVDIVNAADWLVIVVLIEAEVLLQVLDRLSERVLRWFKVAKAVTYSILFLALGYWWVKGDFLDTWDALLWLVAFIFIELNIFRWQAESGEEQVKGAVQASGSV